MKPVSFKYAAPKTTQAAVFLLGQYGVDAKVLAGGQSLMPLLNMRLARPAVIVDLNRIQELNYIRAHNDGIAIGALARQRRLEDDPLVAARVPLLATLAKWIGHPQIRNRGTIVGSIAHADPSAELPAAAVALDAELTAVGPNGSRTLSADELYLGYLVTALEPDELLTEVRFPPLPPEAGWSIHEVARRHGDLALVGVIALVTLDRERIREARLTYFGVGGRPTRLPEVEARLAGAAPSEPLFAEIATHVAATLEADDDIHASADYRRSVAGVLTRRALHDAVARAKGTPRP